jgi:hypothetical protein
MWVVPVMFISINTDEEELQAVVESDEQQLLLVRGPSLLLE